MQKGFGSLPFLISILVILLVIVGVGVTFVPRLLAPRSTLTPNIPPLKVTSSDGIDETANWKTYTNNQMNFSIKYPGDKLIVCGNKGLNLLYGMSEDACTAGEGGGFLGITDQMQGIGDVDISSEPDCYDIQKEDVTFAGQKAVQYSKLIKKDTDACTMPSAYARYEKSIVVERNGKKYFIYYTTNQDEFLKNEVLMTFKFLH